MRSPQMTQVIEHSSISSVRAAPKLRSSRDRTSNAGRHCLDGQVRLDPRPHCRRVPQCHSLSSEPPRRTSASSFRRRSSQEATTMTRGMNMGNRKVDNCRLERAANSGMVGKAGSEVKKAHAESISLVWRSTALCVAPFSMMLGSRGGLKNGRVRGPGSKNDSEVVV
jgi:hypothetical protein